MLSKPSGFESNKKCVALLRRQGMEKIVQFWCMQINCWCGVGFYRVKSHQVQVRPDAAAALLLLRPCYEKLFGPPLENFRPTRPPPPPPPPGQYRKKMSYIWVKNVVVFINQRAIFPVSEARFKLSLFLFFYHFY